MELGLPSILKQTPILLILLVPSSSHQMSVCFLKVRIELVEVGICENHPRDRCLAFILAIIQCC